MVKSLAFFTLFAFFAVLVRTDTHDFLFVKHKMKWHDAERYCRGWGGELATVGNAMENAYIHSEQRRRKMTSLWIGYNDNNSEGNFRWLYANWCNRWTNWRRGEPNGGRKENCVEMWDGGWNDKRCNVKRDFVCRKRKHC